jgi:hypothetical protein
MIFFLFSQFVISYTGVMPAIISFDVEDITGGDVKNFYYFCIFYYTVAFILGTYCLVWKILYIILAFQNNKRIEYTQCYRKMFKVNTSTVNGHQNEFFEVTVSDINV